MQKTIFSELNPNISVNCVTLGFAQNELKVLVNINEVKKGKNVSSVYALPESLIRHEESLKDSAKRILKDFTNPDKVYFEQLYTFGKVDRNKKHDIEWMRLLGLHADERLISVTYFALLKPDLFVSEQTLFDKKTEWIPFNKLPKLAFDHNDIVEKALLTLKRKLKFEALGIELLPDNFTLSELQALYETVLDTSFDKRNFRRKILNSGLFENTFKKQTAVTHKPAELFTINKEKYDLLRSGKFDLAFINF
ncbi:MAG TPA: NUDIX hydrolase [Bacteroidales bacterium]|nr:MAG: hypothetical protein A2W98_01500 [Bacteroidetes bacterium GWF2_33_38]OFY85998.1 MAG: hypothetical protein A2236_10845 [Bacteroidetes bacterium RIFOXYA2_FULL_33_7]HBF88937.1 NUDIX hydrolase [Bacteroidales bacterium]